MDNICAQTAVPYLLQSAHYYVIVPIIAEARRRLERSLQVARENTGFGRSPELISIVLVAGIRSDRCTRYADRLTATMAEAIGALSPQRRVSHDINPIGSSCRHVARLTISFVIGGRCLCRVGSIKPRPAPAVAP